MHKKELQKHIIIIFTGLVITLLTFQSLSYFKKQSNINQAEISNAAACNTAILSVKNSTQTIQQSRKYRFWEILFRWFYNRRHHTELKNSNIYKPLDEPAYQMTFTPTCLEIGSQIYSDDDRYTFYSFPDLLQNAVYIQTNNVNSKNDNNLNWNITLNQSANVYILYRIGGNITPPVWITESYTKITPDDFTEQNIPQFVVRVGKNGMYGAYDIYKKNDVETSTSINFKNSADRPGGAYSMYIVAVVPQNPSESTAPLTPSPTVSPSPSAQSSLQPTATPIATAISTSSPSPTPSRSPSPTPTRTPSPTPTHTPSSTPSPTPVATQTLLQIVAPHNTKSDCWTVYQNHIYNITGYFGMHPAGDNALSKACGKDMTSGFSRVSSHDSSAIQILEAYRIQ